MTKKLKTKNHSLNTIHVIYGPTASGKSALALKMAGQHNGIIINADSMQIYDALHVLTAQPSEEEQRQAPHKLYATLHPSEKCSAARWREMAHAEIRQAFANGQAPIIVGGTGFYFKTLMEGLSPIPEVPDEVRQEVTKRQQEMGNPAFHAALAEKDPEMAARLEPGDTQRLVRAWEVLEGTGKSLAYWQSLPPEGPPDEWEFETHFINPARDVLYERCNKRFDMMIEKGIMDEVKALAEMVEAGEVPRGVLITHALGFHPLCDYMDGKCTLEEAVYKAKQETRNYAKRQLTWFRNQMKAD